MEQIAFYDELNIINWKTGFKLAILELWFLKQNIKWLKKSKIKVF